MLTVLSKDPVFVDPDTGAILVPVGEPHLDGGEFWQRCKVYLPESDILGGPVLIAGAGMFPCEMIKDFDRLNCLSVDMIRYA
jgi:hypothetical protein